MDDELELMVNSDEFDSREVTELDQELLERLPKSTVHQNEHKRMKIEYGQEDINIGPSSFKFLAESERKEDAKADEEEALENRGLQQDMVGIKEIQDDLSREQRARELQEEILSFTDEQKKLCKKSLHGVIFRPPGYFIRKYSSAKHLSTGSSVYEWPQSENPIAESHIEIQLATPPPFTVEDPSPPLAAKIPDQFPKFQQKIKTPLSAPPAAAKLIPASVPSPEVNHTVPANSPSKILTAPGKRPGFSVPGDIVPAVPIRSKRALADYSDL